MLRGDGTGPMGKGERTGRAAGYCAGFGVPGHANRQEIPRRAMQNASEHAKLFMHIA
jgi:hypothetical protein